MKKILITFICILLMCTLLGIPAMADGEFKIVSSTPTDGEREAEVSALITVWVSHDVGEIIEESVTCLPASVSEVKAEGKEIKIRLAFPKEYNTEYTLDLTGIISAEGKTLEKKTISFKTKEGEELKILEDDFETKAIDTTKWRATKGSLVQREGDEGNWCYSIADGGLDNYAYPLPYPLGIKNKAILDFDILIENATADFTFFTMLGNNGLSGDEAKSFETYWTGLLGYDFESNSLGVLYNQVIFSGYSGYPKNVEAAVPIKEGWNSVRVVADLNEQTLMLIVNGTVAEDASGNSEFEIPFSSKVGSTDGQLINVRIQGTTAASVYLDNFAYRQLYAPVLSNSSVKSGDKISVTCPEIRMGFKNETTALSLKLNGEAVDESSIIKNADKTFSAFLSLQWGESYTLEGIAKGPYGAESSFTLNFTTDEMPEKLIEIEGFYDEGGKRVHNIKSGKISAKLKFWQKEESGYVYLAGVYKEEGGRVEMISLSSNQCETTEALCEKDISVTVPDDGGDYFVRVFVLKDSLTKICYEKYLISGNTHLE